MSTSPRVRVYIACSLDGFIAGPDDDLSWLSSGADPDTPMPPTEALEFEGFMAQVGALLMGRRTYDVVAEMGQWAYGDVPTLIATRRPLDAPLVETIRPITGDINQLVSQAKEAAGEKDVYIDGGNLIRQALDAGLVDEMTITFIPILLAGGIALFDDLVSRRSLEFTAHHSYGKMLQVTARVL